jgi:hypothetical protein
MIANVQERLVQLNRDRQELNEQIHRFASLSEASSFLSHRQTPRSSRLSFSNTGSPENATLAKLQIENDQLRFQLSAQADLNHRLHIGLSSVVRIVANHCDLTANHINKVIEKQTDRLNFFAVSLKTLAISNRSKTQGLKHFSAELATQKASISQILNSFKSELSKARSVCLDAIGKQTQSPNQKRFVVAESVNPRRNVSYGGRNMDKEADQGMRLLASSCDEIIRCIVTQLGIEETLQPTIELVKSPKRFGNQITKICSVTEEKIRELNEEIKSLNVRLISLQGALSPHVSEVVKRILKTITGLANQMRSEHTELLERLT